MPVVRNIKKYDPYHPVVILQQDGKDIDVKIGPDESQVESMMSSILPIGTAISPYDPGEARSVIPADSLYPECATVNHNDWVIAEPDELTLSILDALRDASVPPSLECICHPNYIGTCVMCLGLLDDE